MNDKILKIIQSCSTMRELESEFNKRWGWLRFKEKKEAKDLRITLEEAINSLKDDIWTVEYIRELETTFLSFENELKPYYEEFYIQAPDINQVGVMAFRTMYFFENDKNHVIMLDVTSENIDFTIFDATTGNNLKISAVKETSLSQRKAEMICKEKIIKVLMNYLNDEKAIDKEIKELKSNSI